jgi:CRP-like cAMP-binding protein
LSIKKTFGQSDVGVRRRRSGVMAKTGAIIMADRSDDFCARLQQTLEFFGLSSNLAAEIEDRLIPVTYEKGAIIFLRGSSADLLFWLIKGFVKLYLPRDRGGRILVDLARPGDLLAFIDDENPEGRRQLLEAQTLTKCSVGLLTREHLIQVLTKLDHQTAIRLLEQLNTAWSRIFERHIMFLGSSFRVRLEMVFERLSARFGIEDGRGTLLVPELGHADLAEMIGSSRPMVSKLIGEMTEEGTIARAQNRRFILRCKTRPSTAASDTLRLGARSNGASKQAAGVRSPALSLVAHEDSPPAPRL